MKGFTTTIAKDRGFFRAVLHRNGVPVHFGQWHRNKPTADLDRRKFSGDPWAYAPAFVAAPEPKRRAPATSAAQLSMFIEAAP